MGHHDPYALGDLMPADLLREWIVFWKFKADEVKKSIPQQ